MIGHLGDVQVRDRNDMKVFVFETGYHSCKIWKQLSVDCKGPVLFLKANIKIDCISRNLVVRKRCATSRTFDSGV